MADFQAATKLIQPFMAKVVAAAKGEAVDFSADEQATLGKVNVLASAFLKAYTGFSGSQQASSEKLAANAKTIIKVAMGSTKVPDATLLSPCEEAEEAIRPFAKALSLVFYVEKNININIEYLTETSVYKDNKESFSSLREGDLQNLLNIIVNAPANCAGIAYFKKDSIPNISSLQTSFRLLENLIPNEALYFQADTAHSAYMGAVTDAQNAMREFNKKPPCLNSCNTFFEFLEKSKFLEISAKTLETLGALPENLQNKILSTKKNGTNIANIATLRAIDQRCRTLNDSLPSQIAAFEEELDNLCPLDELSKNQYWDAPGANPDLPAGMVYENYSHLLLSKGKGKEKAMSAGDIKQGKINNCYFLSAVGAIAIQPDKDIRDSIKAIDATNGTYKVRLYLPTASGEKIETWVAVNSEFPCDKKGNLISANSEAGELWLMLIEKAYAKAMGGYQNIDKTSDPARAYEMLSGKTSQRLNLQNVSPEEYETLFVQGTIANSGPNSTLHRETNAAALNDKKKPLSYLTITPGKLVYLEHSYYISGSSGSGNDMIIYLQNTHGNNHLSLSLVDFLHYFQSIVILNKN